MNLKVIHQNSLPTGDYIQQNQIVTINSLKYDGSIRKNWDCKFIESKGDLLTFVGEFDEEIKHSQLGLIRRGTTSYEYYWRNRWYNIFRFHEPGGELRNYYCNVSMPPRFEDGVLDYIDLDIDILVWKDLSYEILDMEEFEDNAVTYAYPEEVRKMAHQSLRDLKGLIERREFPFD
jgi:uncharacterized protein